MTPEDRKALNALAEFYSVAMPYIAERAPNDDEAMAIMSYGARVTAAMDEVLRVHQEAQNAPR